MNPEHRSLIFSNLITLAELIHLESMMPFLLKHKVFTIPMWDDIYERKTRMGKKQMFLLELISRGPYAYEKFLICLAESGHKEAIELLEKGSLKSLSNDVTPFRKPETNAEVLSSLKNHETSDDEVEFHQKDIILATDLRQGPDFYKMASSNRGLCLIINNINFLDEKLKRIASDYDEVRLEILFRQFGYNVCIKRDLEANEMKSTLEEFSNAFRGKNIDSSIVIILTHGDKGVLFGTDFEPVPLEKIFEMFDNFSCPSMQEKPKMFFIQACQGKGRDIGVLSSHESADSSALPCSYEESNTQLLLPTISDMLIAQSTVEGNISIRDHTFGSWFFLHLVQVFSQRAHNTDLNTMLLLVDRQVKQMTTTDGEKQATQITSKGWDKLLFFNPGLKMS